MRLPGTNDGVVRLEETEGAGMRDRIVLPLSHSGMLVFAARRARGRGVLERGAFDHEVAGACAARRLTRLRRLLLLAALATALGGCATLRYYTQVVSGQLDLMRRAKPIDEELRERRRPGRAQGQAALGIAHARFRQPRTRAAGQRQLQELCGSGPALCGVERVRRAGVLARTRYLLLSDRRLRQLSRLLRRGRRQGRGRRAARRGYDVYIGGVPAYSTLGWFDDPVLSTFIQYPEAELARLMFHELAHQLLYVKNDTRFNESFAVTVEQAGVERWLAKNGNERPARGVRAHARACRREFVALLLRYRGILEQYYRQGLPQEEMRLGKARYFAEMEEEYRRLKASWGGFAGYDRWFAGKPNNATLASVALYTELVPAFNALLEREGGDLPRFYAAVKELAKLPKDERDARLSSLTRELQVRRVAEDVSIAAATARQRGFVRMRAASSEIHGLTKALVLGL